MKPATWLPIWLIGLVATGTALAPRPAQVAAATPEELVASYDSLADAILALKRTERNTIRSILATTYRHAEARLRAAGEGIRAGRDVRSDLEALASLVAQLGAEGDASVAAVRKRLLEGGHHHNAAGEQKGIYEEGFVIVTRAAKRVFLASATEIGKLSLAPDRAALQTEWQKVTDQYDALLAETGKGR